MVTTEMLSQFGLFTGLPEQQLEPIVDICEEIACSQGEVLFREGSKAERLYILLEGKVLIQVKLTSRPESLTVASVNLPGQTLGWSGAMAPHHYTASGVCEVNSRLVALDGRAFMQILEQDPEMGFVVIRRIAEVISSRLRNARSVLLKTV